MPGTRPGVLKSVPRNPNWALSMEMPPLTIHTEEDQGRTQLRRIRGANIVAS